MGKNNEPSEKTIAAGYLLDYISGNQIKETKKELVRQRIVRALIHEYGISPDDMERDFKVNGRKKADVAIFHRGKDHTIENVSPSSLEKVGRTLEYYLENNVSTNTSISTASRTSITEIKVPGFPDRSIGVITLSTLILFVISKHKSKQLNK